MFLTTIALGALLVYLVWPDCLSFGFFGGAAVAAVVQNVIDWIA